MKKRICDRLMKMLKPESRKDKQGYSDDETETDLTVNLYTTHFQIQRPTRVSLSTADLLKLANMLSRYMEGDSKEAGNDTSIPVRLDPKKDRLDDIVKKI